MLDAMQPVLCVYQNDQLKRGWWGGIAAPRDGDARKGYGLKASCSGRDDLFRAMVEMLVGMMKAEENSKGRQSADEWMKNEDEEGRDMEQKRGRMIWNMEKGGW